MQLRSSHTPVTSPTGPVETAPPAVTDESLVLRNYDGEATHDVAVTFRDAAGERAFERTYTLSPGSTVSVATRLERAVYRVGARVDGGASASADCLVGSGLDETALVEIGNGLVSVSDGAV